VKESSIGVETVVRKDRPVSAADGAVESI